MSLPHRRNSDIVVNMDKIVTNILQTTAVIQTTLSGITQYSLVKNSLPKKYENYLTIDKALAIKTRGEGFGPQVMYHRPKNVSHLFCHTSLILKIPSPAHSATK